MALYTFTVISLKGPDTTLFTSYATDYDNNLYKNMYRDTPTFEDTSKVGMLE